MSASGKWRADSAAARELFASAALRERFVPSDLLDQWTKRHGVESFGEGKGALDAVEATLDLEQLAEPALAADGSEAFVLPKSIRLQVLAASDRNLLQQNLPESVSATLTELALRDIFEGFVPWTKAESRPELYACITAIEWAQAAGMAADVDLSALQRRQSIQDFVEALAGNELSRFIGRDKRLASLHHLWSLPSHDRPAVLLEGPGGIGKSLLVAKFLSQLIESDSPKSPDGVFVIDFERHEFRKARVSTVFREMIRQTARWWRPEATALLEQRSDELDYGALEGISQISRSSEAIQDDGFVAAQLVDIFRGAAANSAGPRFIVFADTFEEVSAFDIEAANSVARASALLRQAGADVLELYASRAYPTIPFWPRPPARFPLAKLPQREAQDYLRREAHALGIDLSRRDANAAQHKIGGWPLNLRLAVGLMDDAASFDPAAWIASLEGSERRIQATLYQRFLNRIRDDAVRQLAMPGLLLRRLTGPIVEQVLAAPCNLTLTEGEGEAIIARARAIGQLFVTYPSDFGAVWHRADVRALMFPDLQGVIAPDIREDIHRRAAAFYDSIDPNEIERAEHLYHLLQLREPAEVLERHWSPELGPRLKSALGEFPEASAGWLGTKLGTARISVDRPVGEALRQASPERLHELRRVAQMRFQEGNAEIADLLAEVALPHSAVSEFGDLYVQSLILKHDFGTALREADRLLKSRARISPSVRASAYAAVAAIHEGQDRFNEAKRFWNAACRIAQDKDPLDRLNAEIGFLRIGRRMGRTLAERQPVISRAIKHILALPRELSERRVAAREALAEVAEAVFPARQRFDIGILLTDLCANLLRRDDLFVWARHDEARRFTICTDLDIRFNSKLSGREQQQYLNDVCSKMIYSGNPEFWSKLTCIIQQEVDWSIKNSSQGPRHAANESP